MAHLNVCSIFFLGSLGISGTFSPTPLTITLLRLFTFLRPIRRETGYSGPNSILQLTLCQTWPSVIAVCLNLGPVWLVKLQYHFPSSSHLLLSPGHLLWLPVSSSSEKT